MSEAQAYRIESIEIGPSFLVLKKGGQYDVANATIRIYSNDVLYINNGPATVGDLAQWSWALEPGKIFVEVKQGEEGKGKAYWFSYSEYGDV